LVGDVQRTDEQVELLEQRVTERVKLRAQFSFS
jgi:hypothetical protein